MIGLGFHHILQGIDHLLFVVGLLLIVKSLWSMGTTSVANGQLPRKEILDGAWTFPRVETVRNNSTNGEMVNENFGASMEKPVK
jgi:hypothetical protein